MFGEIVPFSKAKMTLMREHVADEPSEWPTLDLTEPTSRGSALSVQNTRSKAPHSSGSPTLVPVKATHFRGFFFNMRARKYIHEAVSRNSIEFGYLCRELRHMPHAVDRAVDFDRTPT